MWQDIFTAVALYLVIEGMIPFINPAGFRRAATLIAQMDDNNMRITGLVVMAAGLLLLFFVRS